MAYKAPKGILRHPAVEACEDAKANGFDDDKHDVVLLAGWRFKGLVDPVEVDGHLVPQIAYSI